MVICCKTIKVRDKDTISNILFRNLLKKSENINDAYISGLFKVNGVKELPSVYLQFESQGKLKEKSVSFRISSFKTPIIDILLNQNKVIFINHTGKEFVELDLEQIDFSKFTGVNFNPLDISYFFLGCIPFSESMELMDFKWTKKQYVMDITDNLSKYTTYLNSDKEIVSVKLFSQYFDDLFLESIKYKKNANGHNMPYMLKFYLEGPEANDISISFIINKISLKPVKESFIDLSIIDKYKRLFSIEKIEVNVNRNLDL